MEKAIADSSWLKVDHEHPIPDINVFDGSLTFAGGGAFLSLIVATPLDSSPRSLARLDAKLKIYLESLFSEFGKQAWGTPREGKMAIYVRIDPDSCTEAFERLRCFEEEAYVRGVRLDVTLIEKAAPDA